MADSPAFELVCGELERRTQLSRLEARGTVRLALKESGLSAHSVRVREMQAVLAKLLPGALAARGIEAGEAICREVSAAVVRLRDDASGETPEAVFSRFGTG